MLGVRGRSKSVSHMKHTSITATAATNNAAAKVPLKSDFTSAPMSTNNAENEFNSSNHSSSASGSRKLLHSTSAHVPFSHPQAEPSSSSSKSNDEAEVDTQNDETSPQKGSPKRPQVLRFEESKSPVIEQVIYGERSNRLSSSDLIHIEHRQSSMITDRNLHFDLVIQVRRAFLEVVRVNYWKQIDSGKLPRKSTATLSLLSSIDVALESLDSPEGLQDWAVLVKNNKYLLYKDEEQPTAEQQEQEASRIFQQRQQRKQSMSDLYWQFDRQEMESVRLNNNLNNMQMDVNSDEGDVFERLSRESIADDPYTVNANNGQGDHGTMTFIRHMVDDYYIAKKVYILTSFIAAHEYAQKKIPYYLGE